MRRQGQGGALPLFPGKEGGVVRGPVSGRARRGRGGVCEECVGGRWVAGRFSREGVSPGALMNGQEVPVAELIACDEWTSAIRLTPVIHNSGMREGCYIARLLASKKERT